MGHHGTWGALRPNLWPQRLKFVVQKAAFPNLYRTILGQTRENLMKDGATEPITSIVVSHTNHILDAQGVET